MNQPTPAQIRRARKKAELSQAKAGELVHAARLTWVAWEMDRRVMPQSTWELFLLKSDQHPKARLIWRP